VTAERRRSGADGDRSAPLDACVLCCGHRRRLSPPSFVLGRSMPWRTPTRAGLVFVAFGSRSLPVEAQLSAMAGAGGRDGRRAVSFTRPVTGASILVSAGEERAGSICARSGCRQEA